MNVSILVFVVLWTLCRLRVSDISATLLTVAFCIAYAFITEVFAPVWRATLMCAIYLGTRLLYRDAAMVEALGAAALGLLLFDPRPLFTASFDWPVGAKLPNNDSMVWRVSYSASSALLEGDAEKQVERRVAALHHPTANLLKVGHHGSANATTPELVASANPQFAVISAGSENSFGLPRTEILGRLSDAGARVDRSDLDGAVTLYLDGHSLTASLAAVQ